MVKAASVFSQVLRQIPTDVFHCLAQKHKAERNAKGFTCRTQLVAMLFCHLAKADSLREICNGLKSALGKLKHLGISKSPNKSTLSYANEHRPAQLYIDLYYALFDSFVKQNRFGNRKHKFRFKNRLLSLDSSTISLCLSLFPWAKFRRAKGGVKVHVLLEHDTYMPSFVRVEQAAKHDVTIARSLALNPGSIVAMDRAYNDYRLFGTWTERGVFFVTRLKENAQYEVIEERPVPKNRNISSDQTIRLTGVGAQDKCPYVLRRIEVWDAENEREIVLLTNHIEFGATTIADIYRERWQIELFFKALKQTLKVKTFVGTSENALLIQIWTALIAMLILKWLHFISTANLSFSNLASLLRQNLFTYRDLLEFINDPFNNEPIVPDAVQLNLPIPGFGQEGK